MNELFVYGPVSGPTGYDSCVRGLTKALYNLGVSIKLFPFANWSFYLVKLDTQTHNLLQNMINGNPVRGDAPYLHFCLPEQVKHQEGNLNVNFTMFEIDRIPTNWVEAGNKMDLVIVPTQFSYQAWVESGVDEWRVKVVPLGVDGSLFTQEVVPLDLIDKTGKKLLREKYKNIIISVLEVTNRKNLEGLLRLYYSTVKPGDTCLILKCSSYSHHNKVEDVIERVKIEVGLREGIAEFPPVYVYKQILPVYVMDRLLAVGTHYLSMSYAEGWDLPAHEMAALGKVIIVPNHSGYTEWTTDSEDCFLIEADRKEPATQGGGLQRLYEKGNWCIPNFEDGKEKLKLALEKGKGKQGLHEKVKGYTWENSAKKVSKIIENVV